MNAAPSSARLGASACLILALAATTISAAAVDATAPEAASDPSSDDAGASAASADPRAVAPAFGRALAALLPRRIEAGPLFGFSGSRFAATSQYAALILPTSAPDRLHEAPTWGGLVTAHWNRAFSLTLSPRRETYGLATREATVAFPGNPFPHTLKAETELTYNVWPLMAGMGWSGRRQGFRVLAGAYAAWLVDATLRWTVDGNPGFPLPGHRIKGSYTGAIAGIEYALRLGRGSLALGLETQRASESLLEGLDGSLMASSSRFHLACLWTLLDRRP